MVEAPAPADELPADPRAAFAHLKLTSGITSFVGFLVLPRLSLRRAALVTAAANAFGALGLVALLAKQKQLQERAQLLESNGDRYGESSDVSSGGEESSMHAQARIATRAVARPPQRAAP